MKTRKLGFSDLNLTTIGFGTYALGGGNWEWGWGPQDDANSIAAMHRGLEQGINWIDAAAAYGLGHAENGRGIFDHVSEAQLHPPHTSLAEELWPG